MPNRPKQQRMKRRLWAMQTHGTMKALLNYVARLQATAIKREFTESQRIYNKLTAVQDEYLAVSGKGFRIPTYLRPSGVDLDAPMTCFDAVPPSDVYIGFKL